MIYRILCLLALVSIAVVGCQATGSDAASKEEASKEKASKDKADQPEVIEPLVLEYDGSKVKYDYFPDYQVYRSVRHGDYYWLEGEEWKSGRSLPDTFTIDIVKARRVELDLEAGNPHATHEQTSEAHPISKFKS